MVLRNPAFRRKLLQLFPRMHFAFSSRYESSHQKKELVLNHYSFALLILSQAQLCSKPFKWWLPLLKRSFRIMHVFDQIIQCILWWFFSHWYGCLPIISLQVLLFSCFKTVLYRSSNMNSHNNLNDHQPRERKGQFFSAYICWVQTGQRPILGFLFTLDTDPEKIRVFFLGTFLKEHICTLKFVPPEIELVSPQTIQLIDLLSRGKKR